LSREKKAALLAAHDMTCPYPSATEIEVGQSRCLAWAKSDDQAAAFQVFRRSARAKANQCMGWHQLVSWGVRKQGRYWQGAAEAGQRTSKMKSRNQRLHLAVSPDDAVGS